MYGRRAKFSSGCGAAAATLQSRMVAVRKYGRRRMSRIPLQFPKPESTSKRTVFPKLLVFSLREYPSGQLTFPGSAESAHAGYPGCQRQRRHIEVATPDLDAGPFGSDPRQHGNTGVILIIDTAPRLENYDGTRQGTHWTRSNCWCRRRRSRGEHSTAGSCAR